MPVNIRNVSRLEEDVRVVLDNGKELSESIRGESTRLLWHGTAWNISSRNLNPFQENRLLNVLTLTREH